ncbi:carbonic anhydrase [Spirosoma taeanense]|uniref:carbonic anhydrase n=1 Tax=Spirosoma taeanense TaxID=2735870 RepID=A0A6M5YAD3_9BACT|nr:carbonic anhydrase [Spirosoma taeanense]QJW90326.1 carbonic anhydrase [Spirosoma taeanense]
MNRHSNEFLNNLKPAEALQMLQEGNQRFVNKAGTTPDLLQQVKETSGGQYPFATILSCMDSRTSVELTFNLGIGDVFSIRVAGNVLNEDILGSMEYATKVVGTKIIMVLGHTSCGAIKGACDHAELGHLTQLVNKVIPAIDQETTTQTERNGHNLTFVNHVAELNVRLVMEQITAQSPVIAELVEAGSVQVVGGIYDIATGQVTFLEAPVQA